MGDDFKCDHCGHRINFSAGLCGQCRTGYFRYDPIRPFPEPPQPASGPAPAARSTPASSVVSVIGAIIAVVLLVAMCSVD